MSMDVTNYPLVNILYSTILSVVDPIMGKVEVRSIDVKNRRKDYSRYSYPLFLNRLLNLNLFNNRNSNIFRHQVVVLVGMYHRY